MWEIFDILSNGKIVLVSDLEAPYRAAVISGPQIRAARGLLGWTQAELCRRAGVSRDTLVQFEVGRGNLTMATVEKLVRALEAAGVEMINQGQIALGRGIGVRLRE